MKAVKLRSSCERVRVFGPRGVDFFHWSRPASLTERICDFACEACRVRSPRAVRKPVRRWPPVLFLHVKRFRRDEYGRTRKITEQLFFEELLLSEALGITYSLQAVAVHKGRFGSGHYVAFVRDSQDQRVLVTDGALLASSWKTAASGARLQTGALLGNASPGGSSSQDLLAGAPCG